MQDKTVRCDQCYAEAWITVRKPSVVGKVITERTEFGELDFCLHHYNASSVQLHAQGWSISNDERGLINTKPSVSV